MVNESRVITQRSWYIYTLQICINSDNHGLEIRGLSQQIVYFRNNTRPYITFAVLFLQIQYHHLDDCLFTALRIHAHVIYCNFSRL